MNLTLQDGWYALNMAALLYFVVKYHRGAPDYWMRVEFAKMTRGGLCWKVGAVGGVLAFVLNVLIAGLLISQGWREAGQGFDKVADMNPVIVLAFALVAAPLFEEFYVRGFLQPYVSRWLGSPILGLVAANVVFAVTHLGGGWTHVAIVFVPGLIFGWLRLRCDSVWPAVVAHMVMNALVMGLLYYLFG